MYKIICSLATPLLLTAAAIGEPEEASKLSSLNSISSIDIVEEQSAKSSIYLRTGVGAYSDDVYASYGVGYRWHERTGIDVSLNTLIWQETPKKLNLRAFYIMYPFYENGFFWGIGGGADVMAVPREGHADTWSGVSPSLRTTVGYEFFTTDSVGAFVQIDSRIIKLPYLETNVDPGERVVLSFGFGF